MSKFSTSYFAELPESLFEWWGEWGIVRGAKNT